MSIKKLFDQKRTAVGKALPQTDLETIGNEVESVEFIDHAIKNEERFIPKVDYGDPAEFARFGSAKKYYNDAIVRIRDYYPYDGSRAEKEAWTVSSSFIDLHFFDKEYPRTTGYAIFSPGTYTLANTGPGNVYGKQSTAEYILVKGGPHASPDADFKDGKGNIYSTGSATGVKEYIRIDAEGNRKLVKRRASNLEINPETGNTVEFWLKKDSTGSAYSDPLGSVMASGVSLGRKNEVIFDLHTSGTYSGSVDTDGGDDGDPHGPDILNNSYGRLRIEFSGTVNDKDNAAFRVTYISGAYGFHSASIGSGSSTSPLPAALAVNTSSVADSSWHHYAFTFYNSGSALKSELYVDGIYKDSIVSSSGGEHTMGIVSGAMVAAIGALVTGPSGTAWDMAGNSKTDPDWLRGYGALSGAVDDLRFWKSRRTGKDIGRNWFTQVYGGTNDQDANTDLGAYFKFNEGITNTSSIDKKVLDYSGRISNGTWYGYSSDSRNISSAIVESSASLTEFKDPILYGFHPDVLSLSSSKDAIGTEYDIRNNSSLINSLPDWIVNDDDGTLDNLVQVMASYFDSLYLQIQSLPTIKDVSYISGSSKPEPFSNMLLNSRGFVAPEIFADASVMEKFASRNEIKEFSDKIYDVKNLIYQNIYNNLSFIYKSKGTEKSITNLIRCFGVDEEVLKLNLYSNNSTYTLEDNRRAYSQKKNYANFSTSSHFDATVYQSTGSDSTNGVSYIHGNLDDGGIPTTLFTSESEGLSHTWEAEIFFPKVFDQDSSFFNDFVGPASCLFGQHSVDASNTNYSWREIDYADFQVQAIKQDDYTYFLLTGSNPTHGIIGTLAGADSTAWPDPPTTGMVSPKFYDVYNDEKWNLAVRVTPVSDMARLSGTVGSSLHGKDYTDYYVEFYGANARLGTIENEFLVTGTLTYAQAEKFLAGNEAVVPSFSHFNSPSRIFAGAHRRNYTGSVLLPSDVKISSVRRWLTYLTNDEIKAHAKDPLNYGTLRPSKNATIISGTHGSVYVPKSETLIMNWDFQTVTGSDSRGEFIVEDFSSGSTHHATGDGQRYNWFGEISKHQHPGRGYGFEANSTSSVVSVYLDSARQQLPEVMNTNDMVQVLTQDDDLFTRESRPVNYSFAIEKSMYGVISSELVNFFATINDFNNLIGDPVNKYRQSYKPMEKLRSLLFERIKNTPDLDKFVEYYKWLDSAVSEMASQLMPISADFPDNIRTVIESHILERPKYWHKYPTMEMSESKIIGGMAGIHELQPIINQEHYFKSLTPGGASFKFQTNWRHAHAPIDGSENSSSIWWRQIALRTDPNLTTGDTNVDFSRAMIHSASIQTYNRRKSTPYKYGVARTFEFKGGSNYSSNKVFEFHRKIIKAQDNNAFIKFNKRDFVSSSYISREGVPPEALLKDRVAAKAYSYYKGRISNLQTKDAVDGDSDLLLPFSIYSSSKGTTGDYSYYHRENAQVDITNLHDDAYGPDAETPMQGPFAEKYVGGLQYRHTELNYSSSAKTGIDGESNRAEGWYLFVPTGTVQFTRFISESFATSQGPVTNMPTNWTNVGTTATDPAGWKTISGSTPTSGTGPSGAFGGIRIAGEDDAFGANEYYIYAETSPPNSPSGAFGLVTPQVDGLDVINEFSATFYYHMFGINVGNLKLQHCNSANFTSSPTTDLSVNWDGTTANYIAGQQHTSSDAQWAPASVALDDYVGTRFYLRFLYTAGITHLGDVGLDRVTVMGHEIDSFRLYDITYSDHHRPRAVYYRDGLAKRPVNIANIKQTSSSPTKIGNYTKNYEVVQTSGRDINNLWLKDQARDSIDPRGPEVAFLNISGTAGRVVPDENDHLVAYPSGTIDFTLPERSGNATVFVEKFSAPGGFEVNSRGYLDPASEVYSVYNALPFRNLRVRQKFNRILATSMGKHGYASGTVPSGAAGYTINSTSGRAFEHAAGHKVLHAGIGPLALHDLLGTPLQDGAQLEAGVEGYISGAIHTASFHKINKNPLYGRLDTVAFRNYDYNKISTPGGANQTLVDPQYALTGSVKDNAFISHPIPRSDRQYAWITASIFVRAHYRTDHDDYNPYVQQDPGRYAPYGYQTSPNKYGEPSSEITFISSSDLAVGDRSFNIDGDAATGPGGKEVKVFYPYDDKWTHPQDHTLVMFGDFLGLNILVGDTLTGSENHLGFPNGEYVHGGSKAYTTTNEEYAFSASLYGHAADATVGAHGSAPNWEDGSPQGFSVTANSEMYLRATAFNVLMLNRNGPYGYPSWKQIRTGEHKLVRYQRKNNIINTLIGTQDNTGRLLTYGTKSYTEPVIKASKPWRHRFTIFNTHTDSEPTSDVVDIVHTYENNVENFSNFQLNEETFGLDPKYGLNKIQAYDRLKFVYQIQTPGPDNPNTLKTIKYSTRIYPKDRNAFLGRTRSRQNFATDRVWTRDRRKRIALEELRPFGTPWNGVSVYDGDLVSSNSVGNYYFSHSSWPLDGRMPPTGGVSTDDLNFSARAGFTFVGILTSSWEGTPLPNLGGTDTVGNNDPCFPGTDGSNQFTASNFYPAGACGELLNTYSTFHNGKLNRLSASACYARRYPEGPDSHRNFYVAGDTKWEAGEQRGRYPSQYDTYEDFSHDIKRKGKGMTVIPEFRISEHMNFYLEKGNLAGGVITDNEIFPENFLEITGTAISASHMTSSLNENFYEVYSTTDFLKHFDVIQEDHVPKAVYSGGAGLQGKAKLTKFTMRCKALMRFLPYKGLHPVERTLELASLFSKSLGAAMSYSGPEFSGDPASPMGHPGFGREGAYDVGSGVRRGGAFRVPLTPFYAPGILYNSIKSGVSVDYPVITSDNVRSTGRVHVTGAATKAAGNYFIDGGDTEHWAGIDIPRLWHPAYAGDDEDEIQIANLFERAPFESIIDPVKLLFTEGTGIRTIVDQEPHPSASIAISATLNPDVVDKTKYELYKRAVNNFLAEVPNFYLQDSEMSRLISLPETHPDFGRATNPQKDMDGQMEIYKMMVQFKRGTASFNMYDRPQSFGPPVDCLINSSASYSARGASYSPFTPPYYDSLYRQYTGTMGFNTYGEFLNGAWAIIEFNPNSLTNTEGDGPHGNWSLKQIMNALTVTYARTTDWGWPSGSKESTDWNTTGSTDPDWAQATVAWRSKMPLTSSINLYDQTRIKVPATYKPGSHGELIPDSFTDNGTAWVIQPKWECPAIHVPGGGENGTGGYPGIDTRGIALNRGDYGYVSTPTTGSGTAVASFRGIAEGGVARGVWHQYGEPPSPGKGIVLEISDQFSTRLTGGGTKQEMTQSLIDLCGFDRNNLSTDIGEIANKKVISEAIIAIPFINAEKNVQGKRKVRYKKFFSVDQKVVDNSLKALHGGGELSFGSEDNPDFNRPIDEIINMIKVMKNYVFPPHFDFLRSKAKKMTGIASVDPFVFYAFEFHHELSRQDLTDMWQNLVPESGVKMEEATVTVSHNLFSDPFKSLITTTLPQGYGPEEEKLFGGFLQDEENPIKWMVFKVKKRARTNYYRNLNREAVELFEEVALAMGQATNQLSSLAEYPYSYNWPYDYFSLVELAEIGVDIELEDIKEENIG